VKITTAKELKNRTGEALRHVARGGRVVITRRGKPVAVLSPVTDPVGREPVLLRPADEAWEDIAAQLKATRPRFTTWQEAMQWSRRRG